MNKRKIPLPARTQLKNATDEEFKEAANLPYQSVIGCSEEGETAVDGRLLGESLQMIS